MLNNNFQLSIYLLLLSLSGPFAVDNFTSIPTAMNGVLAVCPGDSFSLTCSHDNKNPSAASTTWILPNVDQCVIIHSFASGTRDCGPFMLTNVSGNTESVLSSTLPTTAVNVPSGFVIVCLDGLNPDSPEIGNITIEIFNVSAPSFEVQQLSQGSLQVNISADDTQCVALYQVDITQNGTSESFSANSSLVPVSGLDLCRYNYTLVGSTRSAGGVQSELSSAVSFSADLSVLNGVNNVRTNQDGSVLEWTQEANVNYPTCITGYIVEWNGMEYSTPSTSATREDLNRAGFPYCQNISVTITPFTPMETLTSRFSMSTVNLVTPGFVAATLSWVYISNDTAMMDGNQTVNMTIRFLGTVQEIADTIVPNRTYGVNCAGEMCTPNVPFTGSGFEAILPNNTSPGDVCTVCVTFTNTDCMRTVESNIIIPGFIVALANETITQSSYMGTFNMPITAYRPDQLSIISTVSPNDSAPVIADYPSSYQYILIFTGLNPGVNYNYTVRIVRRDNQAIQVHPLFPGSFLTVALPSIASEASPTALLLTTTHLVSSTVLIANDQKLVLCINVTLSLPEVDHLPERLATISTLIPDHVSPVTDNVSESSSQHTVRFCDLSPGVKYSYIIRIVLRSNTSIDVTDPITGTFTTSDLPLSMETSVALTFVLTFLLTLVLGVSIGVLSVLGYQRCRRSGQSSQTETEMNTPTVAVYEDLGGLKSDPNTQGNIAYGHVQF